MTILQNTLTGTLPSLPQALQVPDTSGDLSQDIKTLSSAQQQPSAILNLQKAMQNASSVAYKERQASELTQAGKQFDPTKVSGGTFASIIGNLEANRGADVSKIYASTMNAYASAQEQITSRLQYLQELKEQKSQFEREMELREKELKRLKKEDKESAKLAEKQLKEDSRRWELEFALKNQKANTIVATNELYPEYGDSKALWEGGMSVSPQDTGFGTFNPLTYK